MYGRVKQNSLMKTMSEEVNGENISEIKYLRCVFDKSGTDSAESSRKVASGRRVAGYIRSLIKC